MSDHIPISEDWLKSVGFKWHQVDRQTNKHWCLWLGGCLDCPPDNSDKRQEWRLSDDENFAIELEYNEPLDKPGNDPDRQFWFCWFRSDSAGRYHRFIHVRHIRQQYEVIRLVSALTGRTWNPENHINGSAKCDRCAARCRKESGRLDRAVMTQRTRWYEAEKDDTRDRALPEHLNEAIKSGHAK